MKRKDKQPSMIMDERIMVKLITNMNLSPGAHFLWQDKKNKTKYIEISENKITNNYPQY